jgi:hypothetical protein
MKYVGFQKLIIEIPEDYFNLNPDASFHIAASSFFLNHSNIRRLNLWFKVLRLCHVKRK